MLALAIMLATTTVNDRNSDNNDYGCNCATITMSDDHRDSGIGVDEDSGNKNTG